MNRNSIEVTGMNAGYMLVQDEKGKLYRHDPNYKIPKGMIAIVPTQYAILQRTNIVSLKRIK